MCRASWSIMALSCEVTLVPTYSTGPRVQSWAAASVLPKPSVKCALVIRTASHRNVKDIPTSGACLALGF